MQTTKPRAGDQVGARRWPRSSEHPSNWGTPYMGVVLERGDPSAWANTAAFPNHEPSPAQVAQWLQRVDAEPKTTLVPVRWDFDGISTVYWERAEALVPFATDITHWDRARNAARSRLKESNHASTNDDPQRSSP